MGMGKVRLRRLVIIPWGCKRRKRVLNGLGRDRIVYVCRFHCYILFLIPYNQMDPIPRPHSFHKSRHLFSPIDLISTHRSSRSINKLHSTKQRSKKQHSTIEYPQTSRHHRNFTTDQNEQPLNQTFKWVIDKSSSHRQYQESQLSHTLTTLKKTFNTQLSETNKLQEKNKRIQQYTKSAKEEILCFGSSAGNLKQRVLDIEGLIEERRNKQEEVDLDKKILKNMLTRMGLDKMHYAFEERHREKILKFKTVEYHHKEEKKMSLDNIQSLIGIQLITLQDEVGRLEYNRQMQVSEAKNAIRREIRERKNIEERRDIPSLSELHIRKVVLIHTLLEQVLRSKIVRLAERHKRLDSNFRKIKTATNINNLEDLVHKYFSESSLHGKLTKEIEALESQMRVSQQKNQELEDKMRMVQTIALISSKPRKFTRVPQVFQQSNMNKSKMNVISTWIDDKSAQLKLNQNNKSSQQLFLEICERITEFCSNNQMANAYFQNKFFSEGICIKKQPKLLSMSREQQRLALLSRNIREFNQTELEHFNRMRSNVLKMHQKSKTEG